MLQNLTSKIGFLNVFNKMCGKSYEIINIKESILKLENDINKLKDDNE